MGVAYRRPDAGVAEADDVGPAVAGEVGEEPRVLVDPPAAGFVRRSRRATNCGGWNVPSPLLSATYDAGVAEADDVGPAVAGEVGEQARMLVDPPAAGLEAEVGEHELRRLERAVAVAERDLHAGVAEADDVGPAVAGDVGQEPRVLVDPPAAALTPKSSSTNCAGWNVPSPLLSAVHTPASPKPTMSARPSPVRSARNRGCCSTRQPPR